MKFPVANPVTPFQKTIVLSFYAAMLRPGGAGRAIVCDGDAACLRKVPKVPASSWIEQREDYLRYLDRLPPVVTACDSVISFAGRMFNSQQNRLSGEKTAL
jgi:hypothetical protein